jgi:hypothetical protein
VIGQLARADTSREVEEVCHVKAESQSRLLAIQQNAILSSTYIYY